MFYESSCLRLLLYTCKGRQMVTGATYAHTQQRYCRVVLLSPDRGRRGDHAEPLRLRETRRSHRGVGVAAVVAAAAAATISRARIPLNSPKLLLLLLLQNIYRVQFKVVRMGREAGKGD